MSVLGSSGVLPYRILAGIMALTSLFSLLLSLATDTSADLRGVDVVTGLLFALGAVIAWFIAPQVRDDWGLDALIAFVIAMGIGGATVVPGGEEQITIGLGLMLFTVFAAYFRPRRRFAGLLAFTLVGYTLAAVVNPVLTSGFILVVINAAIAGTSIMVNVLSERQHSLALLDPLTGALNRRGLELLAGQAAAAAGRQGAPISVGVIDLDDFKAFNDARGHAAGDRLLVDTADRWRNAMRSSDLLVRSGGDEFALVLVGTPVADAEQLAARVACPESAGWSIGFAEVGLGESLQDALARADARMYEQKAERRLA